MSPNTDYVLEGQLPKEKTLLLGDLEKVALSKGDKRENEIFNALRTKATSVLFLLPPHAGEQVPYSGYFWEPWKHNLLQLQQVAA